MKLKMKGRNVTEIYVNDILYKLSSIEDQKRLYDNTFNFIQSQLNDHTLLDETLEPKSLTDDFISVPIRKNNPYYIHKSAVPAGWNNKSGLRALIKIALIDSYYTSVKNDNRTTHNLSQTVYVMDKQEHRVHRVHNGSKLDINLVDRLDTFSCMIENNKVRKQSTPQGVAAYQNSPYRKITVSKNGKAKRKGFRKNNMELLRAIQYGPANTNKKLRCNKNGLIIENSGELCTRTGKMLYATDIQIHHCYYISDTSVFKTGAPSYYLNSSFFQNWKADRINEFLGCISLCTGEHSMHHKRFPDDDIRSWLDRYDQNIVDDIPYAWKDEASYNILIDWIIKNVKSYTVSDALSYADFIKLHSFKDTDILRENACVETARKETIAIREKILAGC